MKLESASLMLGGKGLDQVATGKKLNFLFEGQREVDFLRPIFY